MVSVVLDLRSNTKRGIANDPSPGVGLFEDQGNLFLGPWEWVLDFDQDPGAWDAPTDIAGYRNLGHDPLARMKVGDRNALAAALRISRQDLPDSDLVDILSHFILGTLADPTGINRVKPLRMGKQGLKLKLGEFGIFTEPFSRSHPNFDSAIAVRIADYRRNRLEGIIPLSALRRWTGYDLLRLYGRRGNDLLDKLVPPEYLSDGWELPQTAVSDNFNRVDNNDPSVGGLNWSELESSDWDIETNTLVCRKDVPLNSQVSIRVDTDLSSDEHFGQVLVAVKNDTRNSGPITRFSASAITFYAGDIDESDQKRRIHEVTTGTRSRLVNTATIITIGDNITVKFESDDADLHTLNLTGDVTATSSVTDTSITGNLRHGLHAKNNSTDNSFDDYIAEDLAVVGENPDARSFMGRMMVY